MSSRPILSPYSVITDGDMSGDLTSAVSIIQNIAGVSYDVSWSGTAPVGTISVQVSDSYTQNADGTVRNAGNWATMPISPAPAVSGNTGNGIVEINGTSSFAIRLVYTRTSGTGTMNVIVTGKVS